MWQTQGGSFLRCVRLCNLPALSVPNANQFTGILDRNSKTISPVLSAAPITTLITVRPLMRSNGDSTRSIRRFREQLSQHKNARSTSADVARLNTPCWRCSHSRPTLKDGYAIDAMQCSSMMMEAAMAVTSNPQSSTHSSSSSPIFCQRLIRS